MGARMHHNQIVKDQNQEHRAGIEPASPRYDGGILPLEDQCLCSSGTGENRTHIVRFKRPMHYLVCHNPMCRVCRFRVRSARKESNLQPSSYKDAALTTEPRAASRAGGNRTHTERFKRPSCCLLHHNPECWLGVCVSIAVQEACWFLLSVSVVVSGSPEDRTQRDPRIRRVWATSPRLPCVIVGHLGVEPRPFRSQSGRASICTCIRCCCLLVSPTEVVAYLHLKWAGRRSNPRLRFFRPPLDRLSYQPILGLICGVARSVRARKKARCLRDIGP